MRALSFMLPLLLAAGCSKPPSVDTFTAYPLPSASIALHSPNGQQQLLMVRFGDRWQGILDDTFSATSVAVFVESGDGGIPEWLRTADPEIPPIEIEGWKPLKNVPLLVVEAWVAGDPALRISKPSSLITMLRLVDSSPAAMDVTAALAGELTAAAGLPDPGPEAFNDPGMIASRVAIEAAARAVLNEDTGEINRAARVALLQIPVFLNNKFLAVEHLIYEEIGNESAGFATSRFSLHDLATGASLDTDTVIDHALLGKFAEAANIPANPESGAREPPADWHPSRTGIVLFYRAGVVAPPERGAVRFTVRWREALLLLPPDSPLRAVAGSIH